ncbi:MAG: hypothetical protein ACLTWR_08810 [Agathobaculum desmolans]|uniref:hypothetical protein n=1 Tax=Agathobaculum desmolans TaxID=39484 RepID=UPI0039923E3C
MERRDSILTVVIGIITAVCGYIFSLDYLKIAESGLTLSSIVLAVYIAAVTGLINSELAKKMKKTVAASRHDKSQLGILVSYFKIAIFFSVSTILLSSLILLLSAPNDSSSSIIFSLWTLLSIIGLVFYVENLVFLVIILRFMLNRQLWDT